MIIILANVSKMHFSLSVSVGSRLLDSFAGLRPGSPIWMHFVISIPLKNTPGKCKYV